MNLNKQQQAAVKSDHSRILVIAGAGSGKTAVITERVAEMVRRGNSPATMLCITFSRKAAGEMRERLAGMLPPHDANRLTVSTFHSCCLRIVRETGEMIGYRPNLSIYDERDQRDVVKMVVENLGYKISVKKVIAFLEAQDMGEPAPELKPSEADQAEITAGEYRSDLRQFNALDFGGLITQAVRILEEFPQARRHYAAIWRHVLVDEFQDTDMLQVRFLKALNPQTMMMVGDYRQSIYEWRGARPDLLMEYADDPATSRYDLSLNYRSLPDILALANGVIDDEDGRYGQQLVAVRVPGTDVQVEARVHEDMVSEGTQIVNKIIELVDHSKINRQYRDIVVLARTNRVLEAFSQWLVDSGYDEDVPHIRIGKMQDFWKKEEIRLCVQMLRLLHNPWDTQSLKSIIKTLEIEVPDMGLMEYRARKENVPLIEHLAQHSAWTGLIKPRAVVASGSTRFEQFIDFYKLVFEYKSKDELSAGGHLVDVGVAWRLIEHYKPRGLNSRMANIMWLNDMLFDKGMTVQEFLDWRAYADLQDELEDCKDENKVRLMTVHAAKGLEFPVVFVLGLTDGDFPHKRGNLEEETRLFYVAATRAADRLFLSCSLTDERGEEKQPSRFMKGV